VKLVQLQKRQTVKSLFKFFKAVSQNSDFSWCCFPVWAPGRNAPFIRFWISALYKLLVYIVCFPTYLFFHHFLLSSLLPYLSFPLRIDPLRFQARCWERQLNLALVFLYLSCVVLHFFWLVNACFRCVRFSSFHPSQEIGLGKPSPKWPILLRAGRKTTTQSINPDFVKYVTIPPYCCNDRG